MKYSVVQSGILVLVGVSRLPRFNNSVHGIMGVRHQELLYGNGLIRLLDSACVRIIIMLQNMILITLIIFQSLQPHGFFQCVDKSCSVLSCSSFWPRSQVGGIINVLAMTS